MEYRTKITISCPNCKKDITIIKIEEIVDGVFLGRKIKIFDENGIEKAVGIEIEPEL